MRFYSKFMVVDHKSSEPRFSLIHALIALIFLCQSPADQKARTICDLFTGYNIFQEDSGQGIFGLQRTQTQLAQEKRLQETFLSREQLNCIVQTFVNVSLILLPLYASDFPSSDKRAYFRLLVEWHKRSPRVAESLLTEFTGFSKALNPLGHCSIQDFIDKSRRADIFEIMMIRQMAKNTLMDEISSDATLERKSAMGAVSYKQAEEAAF